MKARAFTTWALKGKSSWMFEQKKKQTELTMKSHNLWHKSTVAWGWITAAPIALLRFPGIVRYCFIKLDPSKSMLIKESHIAMNTYLMCSI